MKMQFGVMSLLILMVCFIGFSARSPIMAETMPTETMPTDAEASNEKASVELQMIPVDHTNWTLSGANGRIVKNNVKPQNENDPVGDILELTGNGKQSSVWVYNNLKVLCGRPAMLSFKVRRTAGSGGVMTGMSFANFDVDVSREWKTVSLIFKIPNKSETASIRLGQWQSAGTFQYADVSFSYLEPTFSELSLGEDEAIIDVNGVPTYSFSSAFGATQGNYSRNLVDASVSYNTNRWCFGGDDQLVYTFKMEEKLNKKLSGKYSANAERFLDAPRYYAGRLLFTIGYHVCGTITAQYSTDMVNWIDLGTLDAVGTKEIDFQLPVNGAKSVSIRFKSKAANLQLYRFCFEAPLMPVTVENNTPDNVPIGTERAGVCGKTLFWEYISGDELEKAVMEKLLPKESELPKNIVGKRIYNFDLNWKDNVGKEHETSIRCTYFVPDFYREDFGTQFSGDWEGLKLWGCEPAWKVIKSRAIPKEVTKNGLKISAARNDYESCQLVLHPERVLTLTDVTISPLKNADGAEIATENVECRRAFYHFVEHPTDKTCVRDYHPDALPPLTFPHVFSPNENAPLWLTVYVPTGTPSGDYSADVTLKYTTENSDKVMSATVPLSLHVWDFDLPRQNHIETAYGYSPGMATRYHGVNGEKNVRILNDIYLSFLGKYRLSPYTPTPNDGISYNFVVNNETPEKSYCEIDFTRFDVAMEHAIEKYGFTGFNLYLAGMGGGTFHARTEPSILGFGEETIEYQAMFSSMVRQIEAHLREKGWLNMAYVYWFDEPDKKDYEFVRNGMNRIKKYAPGIQTMLTEEPSQEVVEGELLGKIDIWCPVTTNYDKKIADICRAKGERFWWYVCCWPHAPYCTEFTDHSPVELRTWNWQSWQNDVVGTLIWTSNYWTSNAAFPNDAQNPYLDPMSYVSGYSTPIGTKKFWGNGDGRLYYPPLSCATPNKNTDEPVFEQPVPSIRLEMLREGIEDYEMLYLLREKLKTAKISDTQRAEYEALLTVPEDISKSMTEFSMSPMPIYRHRQKVAEAIEALTP